MDNNEVNTVMNNEYDMFRVNFFLKKALMEVGGKNVLSVSGKISHTTSARC